MAEALATDSVSLAVLNRAFLQNFPRDAARKLETMQPEDAADILAEQPIKILHTVWNRLAPGVADSILIRLPEKVAVELLMTLDASPCATLLGRLGSKQQTQFLEQMPASVAKEIRELLEYPDATVGRLMDTRVIAFNEKITVREALLQLRNQNLEELHHLYLLSDDMRLQSQVFIQRLALANDDQTLASLATPIRAFVSVLEPSEEAIEKLNKFNLDNLPVIDANDMLAGVIHGKDLIDAFKAELASDMGTMVGVSKDERALSSAWFAVKKRLPWLQINLLTAFLAAAVVGIFEDTIARYTALAILLPIAAGQSGNTGAQALAVTMRGLTLREITVRHWLRVTLKEAGAALINGVSIAITCGLGVYLWSQSFGLALIIALAMVSSMTIAAVSGALVPIVLKRMGQDPALSASIILTTVTDIAGFMSFLGIATLLSSMLDAA
ncbi:MAG: magnesium transporter [Gammaproteobacteria bacterium]|nr:magnesium transporter [Gammaproteobacteria bacterium]